MDKEKWINEVLNSTAGMQKAEAGPFLAEKVVQRIVQQQQEAPIGFSVPKWALAACFILTLNLFSIGYIFVKDRETKKEQAVKAISAEMGFTNSYTY